MADDRAAANELDDLRIALAAAQAKEADLRALCGELLESVRLASTTGAGHRDAHAAYQRWAAVHAPDVIGDEAKRGAIDRLLRTKKALEAAAAAPIADPAWERIGAWCSAHRRSAWMRVVMSAAVPATAADVERIELRAGREGDDVVLIIDKSNPQFWGLYDLFCTMRFAAES